MDERSFEILLYGITTNVAAKLSELNGWNENEALERFTKSKLYYYLEREETKVWQYSTAMLIQLFSEERAGQLVFPEV